MELVAFPGARLDDSEKEVNLLLWTVFAVARAAKTTRVRDAVLGQSSMQSQGVHMLFQVMHAGTAHSDALWEETCQQAIQGSCNKAAMA